MRSSYKWKRLAGHWTIKLGNRNKKFQILSFVFTQLHFGFPSVSQVWLSSDPPEVFTFSYCAWFWYWLINWRPWFWHLQNTTQFIKSVTIFQEITAILTIWTTRRGSHSSAGIQSGEYLEVLRLKSRWYKTTSVPPPVREIFLGLCLYFSTTYRKFFIVFPGKVYKQTHFPQSENIISEN